MHTHTCPSAKATEKNAWQTYAHRDQRNLHHIQQRPPFCSQSTKKRCEVCWAPMCCAVKMQFRCVAFSRQPAEICVSLEESGFGLCWGSVWVTQIRKEGRRRTTLSLHMKNLYLKSELHHCIEVSRCPECQNTSGWFYSSGYPSPFYYSNFNNVSVVHSFLEKSPFTHSLCDGLVVMKREILHWKLLCRWKNKWNFARNSEKKGRTKSKVFDHIQWHAKQWIRRNWWRLVLQNTGYNERDGGGGGKSAKQILINQFFRNTFERSST